MPIFFATDSGGGDSAGRFTTGRPGLLQQARAAFDSITRWVRPGGSGRIISDIRTASIRLLTAARPSGKTQWQDPRQRAQEPKPGISVIDPRGNVIHTMSADEIAGPGVNPPGDPVPEILEVMAPAKRGSKHSARTPKQAEPRPAPSSRNPRMNGIERPGKRPEKTIYLVLLRHATAVNPGKAGVEGDEGSPLDRKGRKEAKRAARTFEVLGLDFGLVLTSPLQRSVETAQIVAEHLGVEGRIEKTGDLRPDGKPANLFKKPRFRRTGTCILVVGHEPYLSTVACTLIGAEPGAINLRRAGAVMLRSEGFTWGPCAWMEWMITPSMMKMMG